MSSRSKGASIAAIAAALLAGAAVAAPRKAPPDFSGVWLAEPPYLLQVLSTQPPPFRPEAAARYQAGVAKLQAGGMLDWCSPLRFAGYSYGINGNVELITAPDRITLIADDVRLVRRIYTGGVQPKTAVVNDAGVSVGRWEGEVLVVETSHLDPSARFPTPMVDGPTLGQGAHVTERLWLKDKDTLVFDVETTAPEVLAAPDRRHFVYRRAASRVDNIGTFCASSDRSLDRSTNAQRFDMTPPKDLPPPPAG